MLRVLVKNRERQKFGAVETQDGMDSCAVVMPGHIPILLKEIFKSQGAVIKAQCALMS